jgi:hypothetical protein
MEFEAILLIAFFVISLVLGPIFGAESRVAFLRPNQRYRWFV